MCVQQTYKIDHFNKVLQCPQTIISNLIEALGFHAFVGENLLQFYFKLETS